MFFLFAAELEPQQKSCPQRLCAEVPSGSLPTRTSRATRKRLHQDNTLYSVVEHDAHTELQTPVGSSLLGDDREPPEKRARIKPETTNSSLQPLYAGTQRQNPTYEEMFPKREIESVEEMPESSYVQPSDIRAEEPEPPVAAPLLEEIYDYLVVQKTYKGSETRQKLSRKDDFIKALKEKFRPDHLSDRQLANFFYGKRILKKPKDIFGSELSEIYREFKGEEKEIRAGYIHTDKPYTTYYFPQFIKKIRQEGIKDHKARIERYKQLHEEAVGSSHLPETIFHNCAISSKTSFEDFFGVGPFKLHQLVLQKKDFKGLYPNGKDTNYLNIAMIEAQLEKAETPNNEALIAILKEQLVNHDILMTLFGLKNHYTKLKKKYPNLSDVNKIWVAVYKGSNIEPPLTHHSIEINILRKVYEWPEDLIRLTQELKTLLEEKTVDEKEFCRIIKNAAEIYNVEQLKKTNPHVLYAELTGRAISATEQKRHKQGALSRYLEEFLPPLLASDDEPKVKGQKLIEFLKQKREEGNCNDQKSPSSLKTNLQGKLPDRAIKLFGVSVEGIWSAAYGEGE